MRSKCIISSLLPVVNLSLEMYSATSISYTTLNVLPFDAAFRPFWRFFTAHAQFRPYYYFQLKSDVIFEFSAPVFLQRRSHFGHDTIFGDFCDDNVCRCAVSASILLPVANLSPEINSSTTISHKTRTFRL